MSRLETRSESRTPRTASGAAPSSTTSIVRAETISVLHVEDRDEDAEEVRRLLSGGGTSRFSVTRVGGLTAASEAVGAGRFDVVLLDLSLPESFGIATLVKTHAMLPELPIVVLSGDDDERLSVEALHTGAQEFVVKGRVDGFTLRRTVRHALERHRMMIELRLARQRAHFLATHDAVTGLPNRNLFFELIAKAIAYAGRYRRRVGVLYLDLDGFKAVNDSCGHDAGDRVLKTVSQRILDSIRRSDTACRLGGDEFAVFVPRVDARDDLRALARKLVSKLSAPVEIAGRSFRVSASVGIALYPSDGEDAASLVRAADSAMYAAKERGGRSFVFRDELLEPGEEAVSPQDSLEHALDRREFVLHFQPIVDVSTPSVVGVEAFTRWLRPRHGLVLPEQFLGKAERTGLILEIGRWSVRSALERLAVLRGSAGSDLTMTVNLSPRQFRDPELFEIVRDALRWVRLPGRALELDVSESALEQGGAGALETIEALKRLDVRMAIHDFGASHAPADIVRRAPIDRVKIDRRIVELAPRSATQASLVGEIVRMARSLGVEVAAVGVESEDQLRLLLDRRCTVMQGNHLAAPASSRELFRVMSRTLSRRTACG